MSEIEIREATGAELVAGAELLAASLGFADRDAIPAWLMQTTAECGGLALGAFRDGVLGGISYALPCGERALFSCGLAVVPAWRGERVGRRLKLAQRERALQQGRTHIRWTADPLAARALTLYLPGLGARLTGYGAELYAAVRPAAVPADDVVIDWEVTRAAQAGGCPAGEAAARHGQPDAEQQDAIRAAQAGGCSGGDAAARHGQPDAEQQGAIPAGRRNPGACVEIPFDHTALDEPELRRWRLRVRRAMRRALADGAVGTGTTVDRAARRCWVLFEQVER